VEQDHRAIKRVTRPMLNFKSFRAAKRVLADIALMHMIRKGQLVLQGCCGFTFNLSLLNFQLALTPSMCHQVKHGAPTDTRILYKS
jgi:hypothetical protein